MVPFKVGDLVKYTGVVDRVNNKIVRIICTFDDKEGWWGYGKFPLNADECVVEIEEENNFWQYVVFIKNLKLIREEQKMKVFISQKMRGLNHEQILAERQKIQANFIKHINGRECEFIKSHLPELKYKDPITSLSQSLALLAEADIVLIPIWSTMVNDDVPPRTLVHSPNPLKGCEFEYLIAESYGKKISIYDSEYVFLDLNHNTTNKKEITTDIITYDDGRKEYLVKFINYPVMGTGETEEAAKKAAEGALKDYLIFKKWLGTIK